jgi:hypothetical protein
MEDGTVTALGFAPVVQWLEHRFLKPFPLVSTPAAEDGDFFGAIEVPALLGHGETPLGFTLTEWSVQFG